MRYHIAAAAAVAVCLTASAPAQAQSCDAPAPVCAAAANVVMISSFEPVGSAVIVADGLLVTNRHMVADNAVAKVVLGNGKTVDAEVVETDYPGDLVMLKVPGLALPAPPQPGEADMQSTLFAIGYDVGREAIRVYAPGRLIVARASTSLARLHHTARSLPGNSGGALVDASGRLVGIVASGGEGRNEAIPIDQLGEVVAASGPEKAAASQLIGRAYRRCVELLDDLRNVRGAPVEDMHLAAEGACRDTNNPELMNQAARVMGMQRAIEAALNLLTEARDQDPNAPNTLISLAVTYHIAGRYSDEIPLLWRTLDILPDEPQLLRLALQAGIWGGDQALADMAMTRIEAVLPQMAPAARRFYESPPPAPRRQPPK